MFLHIDLHTNRISIFIANANSCLHTFANIIYKKEQTTYYQTMYCMDVAIFTPLLNILKLNITQFFCICIFSYLYHSKIYGKSLQPSFIKIVSSFKVKIFVCTDSSKILKKTESCYSVLLFFRHSVPLSLCPSVPLSLCPSVPLSLCPSVPLSLCPSVPLSLCPSVPLSLCPSVPLSLCPSVPLFLSPSVPLSLCLYVSMSLCPSILLFFLSFFVCLQIASKCQSPFSLCCT
jgi:hypothetical protein